jgi:error-prone DNA polymerase
MVLNAHSYYSLRYGTIPIESLADLVIEKGYPAIVLTDINNTSGSLEYVKLCQEKNIKPILGVEFKREDETLFIGIARNNEGFRELNELLTHCHLNKLPYPGEPDFNQCYVIYPYGSKQPQKLKENEWIGVKPKHLNKIIFDKDSHHKYVIHQPVVFKDRQEFDLHKKLRAIDHNLLGSKLQTHQHADQNDYFVSCQELLKTYGQFPVVIENTRKIIADCHFDFDVKAPKNKKTFTENRYEDLMLLEKLAFEGLRYRYGEDNQLARSRVVKELAIIDKLGFSSYFLITWDIIQHSMSRGFYHVGRGSGANSVIAYCLKITDVCPIELNLYFERFLNPKRKSPPDFDIDYSWKDRDEVLKYIFKKYGPRHTALLGAVSTFRDKSIIRELGKVYGLPKSEIDAMIDNPNEKIYQNGITKEILAQYKLVAEFPNVRSIHAGGILISEEPITNYVALDLPPKGFPTVQFDMYTAEDIHFDKLDILSQRGIGHIKEAVEIIQKNQGIFVDIHEVEKFKKDEKLKQQIKRSDTIGCFYIESPAMRGLLKKLRCDNYLSLVAASSIIRPGVAQSGMMRQYIYRFNNPGKFEYLHPVLEEQLKETYGVMVYQEDVLKICYHYAGLDLGDADILRRMMSGKHRTKKHLDEIISKFFSNAKKKGYSEETTKEVWRQIESFAGYSFSKAHSASYAVESYQSLFLKTHYPLEFMTAVINNFGGFYQTRIYVNEARKAGATVHLPCVNKSTYFTTICDRDIYLGFVHIANLEETIAKKIETERERNGSYSDLNDFINRIPITIEQLIILVRINAIRFTGKSKKQLLWESHLILGKSRSKPQDKVLFHETQQEYTFPTLAHSRIEDAYDEMELLGFPVTVSPFDMLKTDFRGEVPVKDLINHVGRKVRLLGYFVANKNVRTMRGDNMNFGTFLDVNRDFFDTTHFPEQLRNYPFKGSGIYLILGKVVEEFGFPSIEVEKMAKLPIQQDPRAI